MLDIDYMDEHRHDKFPFELGELNHESHLLSTENLLFISNTLQEVEVEIDHNKYVSDFSQLEFKFHWV